MKQLLILSMISFFGLIGCETIPISLIQKGRTFKARITYYTRHEDKWGSRVACSTKMRAKQGTTIAAHPYFPFWTKIFIPMLKGVVGDGHFTVQDRGGAVTSRKAVPQSLRSSIYDFDVYLACSNKAMRGLAATLPPYMDVLVENGL